MRITRARAALAGLTGAAATALAACGGTSAAPQPAPAPVTSAVAHAGSPSASPAPSPSLDPAAQAAVTSYTKMWQSVEADARGGAYNILGLSAYVTGKPLQLFSENLANWHAEGAVIRGEMVMSPTIAGETPTAVQITDHFDDSHALLYYSATGALVNDKPGGCHLVHAAVSDMRGVWRVTSLDIGAPGTCPAP